MTLEEKIAELNGLNKEPLLEKAIELVTANHEQAAKLEEQEALILELNTAIDEAVKQAPANGLKVITVDGKNYRFTAPHFEKTNGEKVITADLTADSDEVKRLLTIGSGLLVETENEEE
jgi:phosphoglycolate phosphatase-like HAD superfamily hydrolase